jgi:maltooligosyltrehalose trehalohydrolase
MGDSELTTGEQSRRLPIGAEAVNGGGVHFRVWAPKRELVEIILENPESSTTTSNRAFRLEPEGDGYFSALVTEAKAGSLYRFRLDDDATLYPDPASRFQPSGPHGPSMVVDPIGFEWTDAQWKGRSLRGQVLYEMHIGTFTREGTLEAAASKLPELVDTGITVLEIMPIAEFPGRFGWGYDGVDLFATSHLYGTPDDLRRFVDSAHALGLAVILDVVYNHLGPDGNYLSSFSADYFTDKYQNEWGAAINFDGPTAAPVREFFLANTAFWIEEYHFDGLRLDATQQIFDDSADNIMAAITRRVRASAPHRQTLVIGENEPQDVRLLRSPEEGGYGLDAIWDDDFHHTAMVAADGFREAYYTDYGGTPQELISSSLRGYLFQGQHYTWQKKRRGTPTHGVPIAAFVHYLQNHDQVANSATGARLHQLTGPARYRAITAILLLGPPTPLLFQGQEFAASSPFLYFADHEPELAKAVRAGRLKFLAQFPSISTPEMQSRLDDPSDPRTFERSKLDHGERERHAAATALHRDLLRLRREDPVLAVEDAHQVSGAVLSSMAFLLRFFDPTGSDDRLLIVNLAADLALGPAPEPLLAPPRGREWQTMWTSADPRYGGLGQPVSEDIHGWKIPGETAVLLRA